MEPRVADTSGCRAGIPRDRSSANYSSGRFSGTRKTRAGFCRAWIWFGNGPREEIAIETERYERAGYAINDANLRSAALHRINKSADKTATGSITARSRRTSYGSKPRSPAAGRGCVAHDSRIDLRFNSRIPSPVLRHGSDQVSRAVFPAGKSILSYARSCMESDMHAPACRDFWTGSVVAALVLALVVMLVVGMRVRQRAARVPAQQAAARRAGYRCRRRNHGRAQVARLNVRVGVRAVPGGSCGASAARSAVALPFSAKPSIFRHDPGTAT